MGIRAVVMAATTQPAGAPSPRKTAKEIAKGIFAQLVGHHHRCHQRHRHHHHLHLAIFSGALLLTT